VGKEETVRALSGEFKINRLKADAKVQIKQLSKSSLPRGNLSTENQSIN
jgi:hypothetical protein